MRNRRTPLGKTNLYMEVTKDIYQLPVAISEDYRELARKCGVSSNNVISTISKYESGKLKYPRFIRVVL